MINIVKGSRPWDGKKLHKIHCHQILWCIGGVTMIPTPVTRCVLIALLIDDCQQHHNTTTCRVSTLLPFISTIWRTCNSSGRRCCRPHWWAQSFACGASGPQITLTRASFPPSMRPVKTFGLGIHRQNNCRCNRFSIAP
jgi:hypothetical protein